jgi:CRISPR system Cascade subunit CasE
MYLSRLLLDPRRRDVQRDLSDVHALHQRLLAAFPQRASSEPGARAQFGVLYRLDERASGAPQVLVQSHDQPNWKALPGGYLPDRPDNPACRAIDDFYAALEPGMVLRFRLRANPTRRVFQLKDGEDPKWRGKRVELQGDDNWLAWLQRKGEQHGFLLPGGPTQPAYADVRITDEGKLQGRGAQQAGPERLTLAAVRFDGRLAITDIDRFRAALATGIGSGKAYGFGLLSVARLG